MSKRLQDPTEADAVHYPTFPTRVQPETDRPARLRPLSQILHGAEEEFAPIRRSSTASTASTAISSRYSSGQGQ